MELENYVEIAVSLEVDISPLGMIKYSKCFGCLNSYAIWKCEL